MSKIPLKQKLWLSLFLAPFLVGGLVGFALLTVLPLWRALRARGWTESTCIVDSTTMRVVTHDSEDPDTYEYGIRFSYEYRGTRYSSDRYGFGAINRGLTSDGLTRDALLRLPRGSRTVCYVDPEEPTMAVIDRGQPRGWGYGSFPLLAAVLAGLLGSFVLRN